MLLLFRYSIASAYIVYKDYNKNSAYASAISYLSGCIVAILYACIALIQYFFKINLWALAGNSGARWISILLILSIVLLCYKFYSFNRLMKIVEEYEHKKKIERIIWGIGAVLLLIIPILIIAGIYF